jgi:hypothetical protein
VKLTVTGTGADGRPKSPAAGSGFVIHSGAHNSLILTAAHVIGSSDKRQALNPDWQVQPDDRTLSRRVKVEILDERGTLGELGQDASVIHQDDQKDVAVLLIDRTELPTIPFAEKASELQGNLQDVLLLGFLKDERSLDAQKGSGGFRTSPQRGLTFRLNLRVPEGLSGGPVIDLASGKAIALASENIGTGNEHHAVSLFPVLPSITPYMTYIDKVQASVMPPTTGPGTGVVNVNGNHNVTIGGVQGSNITIDRGKDSARFAGT